MGDSRGITPLSMNGNVSENWKLWKARFQNYLIASEVIKKDQKTQCAQLLHYVGEEGFKVYATFKLEEDQKDKLGELIKKFDEHFRVKENLIYERYKFFSYKQRTGQTLENFIAELKNMAEKCKFESLKDSMIVTAITCGITNNLIRERLLQEDNPTLERTIDLCHIIDTSKVRSEVIANSGTSSNIDISVVSRNKSHNKKFEEVNSKPKNKYVKNCMKCGAESHLINKCPAFGKKCNHCKLFNHFANVCFKKKKQLHEISNSEEINTVEKTNNDDFMFIGLISENKSSHEKEWLTKLEINKCFVEFKIDTGAMANVIPMKIFKSLGYERNKICQTTTQLKSYTGSILKTLGKVSLKCKIKSNSYDIEFFVIDSDSQPILGLESSTQLNLIKRIETVNACLNSYDTIKEKFRDVFTGTGCLKEKYHIVIDKNIKPVIHPNRKVALPLHDKLKQSPEELEKS